ncbi:mitochondrial import inner membrane translocase subunit TIM50-A [Drosophila obscura]|uniref:mitochondrial import inner membrane translocase subunit TIM50-A n=1 Tax=Drosophila obscura TaxID=7282 RepID=UPI001BB1A33B|nr:mitochondrial import inner membrane translocase subunit TIM50-A [Drosophila obscura]
MAGYGSLCMRGVRFWMRKSNSSRGCIAPKKCAEENPLRKLKSTSSSSKASEDTNTFRRIRKISVYSLLVGSFCSAVLWAIYELGKPEMDQHGLPIEDEFSGLPWLRAYLERMWHSLQYYQKMLEEPLPVKLLPDTLPPPYIQPPYTLVLEINDILVHLDWTYQTGWRFKKRPGVDFFLRKCSKHFEIVVYTSEQGMTAFPLLDALDPYGYISYRVVRGDTELVEGQHVKNLLNLNRNLNRVVVVDWDRNATPQHPENAFIMARWLGNDDDVQLFDLTAFLELLAEHQVNDVREILKYYSRFEDPIEQFRENQRRLLEIEQQTKRKMVQPQRHWTASLLGRYSKGTEE